MSTFLSMLLILMALSFVVAASACVCMCCVANSVADGRELSMVSASATRTVAVDASTTGCAAV